MSAVMSPSVNQVNGSCSRADMSISINALVPFFEGQRLKQIERQRGQFHLSVCKTNNVENGGGFTFRPTEVG